jgi:Glycosyl transferase family 2
MSERRLLSIVTITKDDPEGMARTMAACERWRSLDWVEQWVVYAGGAPLIKTEHGAARVVQQTSRGIAGAYNEGLALAGGEWVWFVNGGDAVHEGLDPDWLRTLLLNTAADCVMGTVHCDGEEKSRVHRVTGVDGLVGECWPAHPATLVRRELVVELAGFEQRWKIAGDYDFWCRMFRRRVTVDVMSVPLARFAMGGLSTAPSSRDLVLKEGQQIILKHGSLFFWCWLRFTWRLGRNWSRAACLRLFRRI